MDKQKETSNSSSNRAMITRHNENNTSLNALNLFDETQLAQAEVFLKKIVASEKGGVKSVADGLAILMRTKDLNLPFSSCIEHIHVINGKTGIDVHIAKSVLLRAGIVFNCTKDYVPQYQYTDGNTIYLETQLPDYCVKCRTAKEALEATKDDVVGVYPVQWFTDLKGNVYNEFQVSDKCIKAINKAHALKLVKEGQFPVIRIPAQPIDFVTEYEFTRYKVILGNVVEQKATSHFSYSEAQTAELLDRDTYKKYARIMVGNRAFMLGAREIADDLLMGCMETTELKAVENVDIVDSDFLEINPIDLSED